MGSMNGIYIGVSGLQVSQNALNVTSHNLANVDTDGFVRQQVVVTDFRYANLGENHISYLQKGLGANFAEVKQVRDIFLDKSFRLETGRGAFYQAQSDAVSEIEGYFGELQGSTFQDTMGDFWTALQELAKEPDSVVARASLTQTAVTFIERAETISNQLKDYQVNLNTQIKNQVSRINEIGDQINTLNKKIRQYESTGVENANDLRDERNNLLDELSKMINITYKENSSGVVTVTAEGVPLVSEDMAFKMDTIPVSEGSGMLKPVWVSHGNADVFDLSRAASSENNTDVGYLKGLLTARGDKQANYTDIPKRENYETDALYNTAVLEFNNTINASPVMSVQAEFDQLIHGIVTMVNDVLSPNKEVTLEDGTKAYILDTENAPVGLDDDKTMGNGLFNRKATARYTEVDSLVIRNDDGTLETLTGPLMLYNGEDPEDNYSLFTLGEIEVNPDIMQDLSLIPLSSNTGSGDYDVETAKKLISKWQESFSTLTPNSLTEYNFNGYYNSFISELANRGDRCITIGQNQASMVESINNERTKVTGVSSDEELTNLIKYQHAYNASARYITTVSQMLEDIVTKL